MQAEIPSRRYNNHTRGERNGLYKFKDDINTIM